MAKKKFSFGIKRPGKLTAQARREGKTVHQVAEQDKKSSSPLLRKEGTFALNAEDRFGKGKRRGTKMKGVPTAKDVRRAKSKRPTKGTRKRGGKGY
jgi:hypothetical protein